MNNFDAVKVKGQLVQWIRNWFKENGDGCNAIIMSSGGKDSFLVAILTAMAIGKDRVIMIGMPDGNQGLNDADKQAEWLGVRYMTAPITEITNAIHNTMLNIKGLVEPVTVQSEQNVPPRVRMTLGYAISQCLNGRVSENCNYSENFIGYCTKFGDSAGDYAPLTNLTVTEIYKIIDTMDIPKEFIKAPDDGLPHSCTDEEKFGFTYAELDDYIRNGIIPTGHCHNNENECLKIEKIKHMHKVNQFKMKPIASFEYKL